MPREVPLPIRGDLRAFDAVIRGRGWTMPVEAETRPHDSQALERRIALKLRDARIEHVMLLLLDSAHNRRFVRSLWSWDPSFTVGPKVALERLAAGSDPGGSAMVLL